MKNSLKIAVLSDLHAGHQVDSKPKPSRALVNNIARNIGNDSFVGLKKLIQDEGLQTDYLLCAGDICDKADASSLQYAWKELNEIKTALCCECFAATAGNHDMDSRFNSDYDAKGLLLDLLPHFPLPDPIQSNEYWSRNLVLHEGEHMNLLLVNSSAYHGYENEKEHGRISERTLRYLKSILDKANKKPVNILLTHHHPHKNDDIEDEEYSEMKGGHHLLKLLDEDTNNWLVIHGHKHHPRLCYSSGSSTPPIVFGAGSFSAFLYEELQTKARNQFYIIEFPLDDIETKSTLLGTIKSYDWVDGSGWKPSKPDSGLASCSGFGHRINFGSIAKAIAQKVDSEQVKWIDAQSLCEVDPLFQYILPKDVIKICGVLLSEHSIKTDFDMFGNMIRLGIQQ